MTLNATNAIETARTATLNAVGFVSNGNFGVRGHK
jgi:formate dehydrogenase assembly factor FdhD